MRKKLLSLMLCASMAAATFGGTAVTAFAAETEDPVSLRIVMYGDAGARNTEFFQNEFHDKVMEDLNIDMTVDYVPWGGGAQQLMTMAASGEGFAFMSTVTESPQITSAGLYTTFTQEMFDELAPHYEEARMGRGFDCAKYKGEIITIPCGAIPCAALNDNISIRNDILNEVGWDVSKIKDYDDLMEAIAAVHEAYPDMKIVRGVTNLYMMLLSEVAPDGALFKIEPTKAICMVDDSDPESDTVISNLESEYFKNLCAITKEWMNLGYLSVENLTDSSIEATAWTSGNCLLSYGSSEDIYNHTLNGVEGADVRYLKISKTPNLIKADSNSAWMVTKADQDKAEDWVRFFDWMYASKENYMFSLYGIEGTDWQYKEDGSIERLTQDSFFYDWMCKTMLYEEPSKEVYDPEEVEEYIHFDDDGVYSKEIGFAFDKTPVETEAVKLQTIIDEKVKPIAWGVGDYEKDFPAVLEELKEAGLDKYVAEYQKQFSEFMATK